MGRKHYQPKTRRRGSNTWPPKRNARLSRDTGGRCAFRRSSCLSYGREHPVSRVLSWVAIYQERLAAIFTRPRVGGQPHPLLFGLAPDGVCLAWKSLSTRWALTPPFHPCPGRAVCLCGTFLWFAPTGYYPASCPAEPGLSSLQEGERPPRILPDKDYTTIARNRIQ